MRARALVSLGPWLLAGCMAVMLAGCAERWSYTKPGLTPARLDLDLETCRREAHRPHWLALTRSARLDQDVLNQCMERKGYNAQRDE